MSPMESLLRLAKAEFDTIHAVCDRALIPREANGEKLSAAQRVQTIELVLQQYIGGAVDGAMGGLN